VRVTANDPTIETRAPSGGTFGSEPFGSSPFGGSEPIPAGDALKSDGITLDGEPGLDGGDLPPIEASLSETLDNIAATGHVETKSPKTVAIRNKGQVLFQSHILVTVLEQAIAYNPLTQHNQQKPELFIELGLEKPEAVDDVKALIAELKKLNGLLSALNSPRRYDEKTVIDLRKHLNAFLNATALTAGTGAGLLILGVASSLLYQLGGKQIVDLALQFKPH
jgi:hypothetical protein